MKIPPVRSSDTFKSIDFTDLSRGRAYHLMTALVVPRPIAFVTSMNQEGIVNAAPFSWYQTISASPPMISIAIGRKDSGLKDTASNINLSKEFVINFCSVDMAEVVQYCAHDFSSDISEADRAGLTLIDSTDIKTPRIANSPCQFECRLVDVLKIGSATTDLYIGQIIRAHVASDSFEGDRVSVEKLNPLARLDANSFAGITKSFTVKVPDLSD